MGSINTKCLDFLKFLASCVIAFLWHYQHFSPLDGSPFFVVFKWSYNHGWLMVELFFVLSGFGMFLGYSKRIQNRTITFKDYIIRRLKRIYPLFFFSTILVVVLESWHCCMTGYTFVYPNFDYWHLYLNLIMCQDGLFGIEWSLNSPSWCISISFMMYIIMFIVMRYSPNNRYIYIYIYIYRAISCWYVCSYKKY